MKTADKIKHLRLQKGFTQEELGKIVGVQRAAINKYEKGTVVNIKRSTLQKLADALGVLPVDLLDDEEIRSEQMTRLQFYISMMDDYKLNVLLSVARSLVGEESDVND